MSGFFFLFLFLFMIQKGQPTTGVVKTTHENNQLSINTVTVVNVWCHNIEE